MMLGDDLPVLEGVLQDKDGVINLTGCTVALHFRHAEEVARRAQAMTVVDAEAGSVQYSWQDGDIVKPGQYFAKAVVTDATGKKLSVPNHTEFTFQVKKGVL